MEGLINNLIKAIGWTIIHSLWQGAIIYATLFIVFAIRFKNNAKAKYNLSFAALFMMFISFFITFFSFFQLPNNDLLIENITLNSIGFQDLSNLNNNFFYKLEVYLPIIVLAYVIGVFLQASVLLFGYQKLQKLKHAHISPISAQWEVFFFTALSQLNISKKVDFYLSSKVNVPLVIGYFKPVVLFPIALATQLDTWQIEAILYHELSHIRRNDYLLNLIKSCIETLLFFNPFVWLTAKFINIEREHACDDLAVNFTGRPISYAQTLLELEVLKNKQTPALSLAAIGNNQHLYQRIKRITNMKTNYVNPKQHFLIITLTIAIIASIAWINPAKKQEVKVKETKELVITKPKIIKFKSLIEPLFSKSDTDSVKNSSKKFQMTYLNKDGKKVVYHSLDELPDSLKIKFKVMEEKFDSPEWKEKMAAIQKNGEDLQKKFDSSEWKEKMAAIQKNGEDLQKKFDSPEWKEKMAAIQKNGEDLQKKFDSSEWKEKMAAIQKNGEDLQKKFDSPEWKEKMAAIQKNGEELQKKFDSPEWKEKMEDLKKLYESTEFKELRKKYENDVEDLKKNKGIKNKNSLKL